MNILSWREVNCFPEISSGGIQIWSARLDQEESSNYLCLLSPNEIARAERLKNVEIANQQIICRGILRILLSRYLNMDPGKLEFNSDHYGKPYLSNPLGSAITFNIAHSENVALFAFSKDANVGVDIEKMEIYRDFTGISRLVFSDEEQLFIQLSNNPVEEFYKLWTAKEAVLKASGRGFSYPSSQFSVVLTRGKSSKLKLPPELSGEYSCFLKDFIPVEGYSGAVAIFQ
jgi:4'-phosphopantetheinyl transferase